MFSENSAEAAIVAQLTLVSKIINISETKKYVLHFAKPQIAFGSEIIYLQIIVTDGVDCWIANMNDASLHIVQRDLQTSKLGVFKFFHSALSDGDAYLSFDGEREPALLVLGTKWCSTVAPNLVRIVLQKCNVLRDLVFSMARANEELMSRAVCSDHATGLQSNQPIEINISSTGSSTKPRPQMSLVNPNNRKRKAARGFRFKNVHIDG